MNVYDFVREFRKVPVFTYFSDCLIAFLDGIKFFCRGKTRLCKSFAEIFHAQAEPCSIFVWNNICTCKLIAFFSWGNCRIYKHNEIIFHGDVACTDSKAFQTRTDQNSKIIIVAAQKTDGLQRILNWINLFPSSELCIRWNCVFWINDAGKPQTFHDCSCILEWRIHAWFEIDDFRTCDIFCGLKNFRASRVNKAGKCRRIIPVEAVAVLYVKNNILDFRHFFAKETIWDYKFAIDFTIFTVTQNFRTEFCIDWNFNALVAVKSWKRSTFLFSGCVPSGLKAYMHVPNFSGTYVTDSCIAQRNLLVHWSINRIKLGILIKRNPEIIRTCRFVGWNIEFSAQTCKRSWEEFCTVDWKGFVTANSIQDNAWSKPEAKFTKAAPVFALAGSIYAWSINCGIVDSVRAVYAEINAGKRIVVKPGTGTAHKYVVIFIKRFLLNWSISAFEAKCNEVE